MLQNQKDVDFVERDYGYVAYLRKAIDNSRDLSVKEMMTQQTMFHEGRRDYFTVSLRQINHLIQFDQEPNLELMEPKWELYKVSISFELIGK